MNKIKFSHKYKKLNGEKTATLEHATLIHLEHQTKGLIAYDAEGIYKLPKKGCYIALVFVGEKGTLFTTLRRYTMQKRDYYFSLVGEQFEVVIVKE